MCVEYEKLFTPSAMGQVCRRCNMILPKGRTENGAGAAAPHSMLAQAGIRRRPRSDNRPTWLTVRTVVRRILLSTDFPPVLASYSSAASDPGGGSLRSNATTGVSPMSVSSDMCGRSWLYHVMNRARGSISITGRLPLDIIKKTV